MQTDPFEQQLGIDKMMGLHLRKGLINCNFKILFITAICFSFKIVIVYISDETIFIRPFRKVKSMISGGIGDKNHQQISYSTCSHNICIKISDNNIKTINNITQSFQTFIQITHKDL